MNYFGKVYARTAKSFPTGPGSRGGQWHNIEYRRQWHKAWRAAHPEYMERRRAVIHEKRHPGVPLPPRAEQ